MVKTRQNTPFLRTLRSGNGRGKNIGNREEKVSLKNSVFPNLHVKEVSSNDNKLHMLMADVHEFYTARPKFID